MQLPMLAIPAITDEDISVKNPTNMVLVQMDVPALAANLKAIRNLSGAMEGLLSVRFSACEHEFVQTFEPEDDSLPDMQDIDSELAFRLDDLATSESTGIQVDASAIHTLRSYGLIKICNTVDEAIEFDVVNNTLRFVGKYAGKHGYTCSSRKIALADFYDLLGYKLPC